MAAPALPARRILYGFLIPLALPLAGCNPSHGDNGTEAAEASAMLVDVGRVTPADGYTIRREFSGRVESRRRSAVGFELGGELREVSVDDGARVDSGSAIARLDTARLDARRAEARAALDQAVSAHAFAERSLARIAGAAEFEGASDHEVDVARDQVNTARASIAAARARLLAVDVDIAKSVLRAPYDAVVVARYLDEGQIVSPGQAILLLQEMAAPEVRIGVAGDLAAAIEPGQTRPLRIGTRSMNATVRAVLPLHDPATRTVDVILQLADERSALPGDLAHLDLREDVAERGFWLPLAALAEGNRGLWTAYVAVPLEDAPAGSTGATHRLEPRTVEILYEDASRVYVRGALSGDDLYVSGGLQRIVPGQQVRLPAATAAHRDEGS